MVQSFLPKQYLLMLDISLAWLYNGTKQSKKKYSAIPKRALLPTSVFKNALVTHSPTAQNALRASSFY